MWIRGGFWWLFWPHTSTNHFHLPSPPDPLPSPSDPLLAALKTENPRGWGALLAEKCDCVTTCRQTFPQQSTKQLKDISIERHHSIGCRRPWMDLNGAMGIPFWQSPSTNLWELDKAMAKRYKFKKGLLRGKKCKQICSWFQCGFFKNESFLWDFASETTNKLWGPLPAL